MAAYPRPEENKSVKAILEHVSDIAAMPQVVYKIIELTGTTATAAQDIDRTISVDPGFSSKVLMLANSAFYALPRKVTSIREAATFIGFRAIRRLAMTIGCFEMFVGKSDTGSLRRRTWWRHSVDTAHCARGIAEFVNDVDPDDVYSCGLLHDVGKSFLDRFGDGEYASVEQNMLLGLPLLEAERLVYDCDHAQIAAGAAASWGLPPMLIEAVGQHHGPAIGDYTIHVALTCLSSDIAHAIVEARTPDETLFGGVPLRPEIEWAIDILKFDDLTLARAFAKGKEAIAAGAKLGM